MPHPSLPEHPATPLYPDFAEIAFALRDEIIDFYRATGESLASDAGLRTLDTNSTLAPARGALLIDVLRRGGGPPQLNGLRIADLGCGFGSLSLYFAAAGATVVGVDPNGSRPEVGRSVARRFGLDATFERGWMDDLIQDDEAFDLVVVNNAFCYLERRADRRRALRHFHRILEPGGWLVMRNPSRSAATDPFTGLPIVHQLPPKIAARLLRGRRPPRSLVRLRTGGGLSREIRHAGFRSVRHLRVGRQWYIPPRYQHHTAHKPGRRT